MTNIPKNAATKNIAIIGAGIMGLCAAYTLEQRGHKITIYDRDGFPANNASFKAGGMLAPLSEIEHMSSAWLEAGFFGIDLWESIEKNIGDIGFERKGSLLIAHPEDRHIMERFITHLPPGQQRRDIVNNYEPELSERFHSGVFLDGEAHLNPEKAMIALVEKLKDTIKFKKAAVEPDDLAQNFDHIIDCRGMAAQDENLRGVKGEIVIVRNPELSLSRPVRLMHPRYPLYIVPRDNHIFMIGATVIESAESERVSLRSAMELMSALYSLHPSFGDAEIVDIMAGIRPSYPDNLPRIKTAGNIISCNGFFRHGFLLSPVMAEAVADRVTNEIINKPEGQNHIYMSLFENEGENKGENGDENKHHNQRAA